MFREEWGDGLSPLISIAAVVSEGATGWRCGIIRVRAEGPQSGLGIRNTEHGKRSGIMFAVERCGLGRVKVAGGQSCRILGIVKPET